MEKIKELSMLLEQISSPQNLVKEVVRDFEELGIEYAVIGGVALGIYNYSRFTEDIDILVSKKSYPKIKKLIGAGYTKRPGSKRNLYYHGIVKKIPIDILVAGDKENGWILPDPLKIRQKISGVWYLKLPALIAMKLRAGRPSDIQDVLKLIELNDLDKSYKSEIETIDKQSSIMFLKLV